MTLYITLPLAEADTGPFDLYSDATNYSSAFKSNVPKAVLQAGLSVPDAPDGTTIVRIRSTGVCTNYIDVPVTGITTTTSTTPIPTTTTTTTATPQFNANTTFEESWDAACRNPLNTIVYTNGSEYFYDSAMTQPIESGIMWWKFLDNVLRTSAGGISVSVINCNEV